MAKVSATQQLFAQYGASYYAAHPTAKSVSVAQLVNYVDTLMKQPRPEPIVPQVTDSEMAYYQAMEMEAESRAIEYEEWEARGGR